MKRSNVYRKKLAKQKKSEQKLKKIIIGFEGHSPSFVKKKRKYMEEADVILQELEPKHIKDLNNGISPKSLASRFVAEEYTLKLFSLLNEMKKKGKNVIGTEVKTKESKRFFEKSLKAKNWIDEAKYTAKSFEIRERERLRWLIKNSKELKGTVYLDAGAAHTPLYHEIIWAKKGKYNPEKSILTKKEFNQLHEMMKNVEIQHPHLTKGGYEHPRIQQKYTPTGQLERIYRFGLDTGKKQAMSRIKVLEKKGKLTKAKKEKVFKEERQKIQNRIKKLEKQSEVYNKFFYKIANKYYREGLTEEQAAEKAEFEIMKRIRH